MKVLRYSFATGQQSNYTIHYQIYIPIESSYDHSDHANNLGHSQDIGSYWITSVDVHKFVGAITVKTALMLALSYVPSVV